MIKRIRRGRVAGALVALVLAACGSDGTGPRFETLVITTASLPDATEDEPYTAGVNADGGDGDYQWTVVSGSLPNGLVLSVEDLVDNDVVITGTPGNPGSSTFTLQVESGDGQTATVQLTIDVLPPPTPLTIANVFLPPGVVDAPYGVPLRTGGGDPQVDYSWRIVNGSLPAGLSLNADTIEGTPTATGQSTVTLEVSGGGESKQRTFDLRVVADRTGSYDITTVEVSPVPASIRPYLDDAIDVWETAITGDLQGGLVGPNFFGPNSCGGYGQSVNGAAIEDILIIVEIAPIDGPGNVLGQAGPCAIRTPSNIPLIGQLTLDSEDLQTLTGPTSGQTMMYIINHEIGHVLGYGSLWDNNNLVTGAGTASPLYTGARAVQEWHALGGSGDVPVENTGGEGTADVHWDENSFGNERMTGYAEQPGVVQPLSRVSIAAMADLGYTVDLSAADPFTLPLAGYRIPRADIGYDRVLTDDIQVLRPDGTGYPLRKR